MFILYKIGVVLTMDNDKKKYKKTANGYPWTMVIGTLRRIVQSHSIHHDAHYLILHKITD